MWDGIIDYPLNLKYLNLYSKYLWEAIFVSCLFVKGFLWIEILKIIIPTITDFLLEHLNMLLASSTIILQVNQFSCFVLAIILMISPSLNFSQISKSLFFALYVLYNSIAFSQMKSFFEVEKLWHHIHVVLTNC